MNFLNATGSDNRTVTARISKAVHASRFQTSQAFFLSQGLGKQMEARHLSVRVVINSVLRYGIILHKAGSYATCEQVPLSATAPHFWFEVFVLSLSNTAVQHPVLKSVLVPAPTPSQHFAFQRLKLLGHILRHPDSHEYTSAFVASGAYRHARGSTWSGRPSLHLGRDGYVCSFVAHSTSGNGYGSWLGANT